MVRSVSECRGRPGAVGAADLPDQRAACGEAGAAGDQEAPVSESRDILRGLAPLLTKVAGNTCALWLSEANAVGATGKLAGERKTDLSAVT